MLRRAFVTLRSCPENVVILGSLNALVGESKALFSSEVDKIFSSFSILRGGILLDTSFKNDPMVAFYREISMLTTEANARSPHKFN